MENGKIHLNLVVLIFLSQFQPISNLKSPSFIHFFLLLEPDILPEAPLLLFRNPLKTNFQLWPSFIYMSKMHPVIPSISFHDQFETRNIFSEKPISKYKIWGSLFLLKFFLRKKCMLPFFRAALMAKRRSAYSCKYFVEGRCFAKSFLFFMVAFLYTSSAFFTHFDTHGWLTLNFSATSSCVSKGYLFLPFSSAEWTTLALNTAV